VTNSSNKLKDDIKRAMEEVSPWKNEDYDGVYGKLDDWMPQIFHDLFHAYRQELLTQRLKIDELKPNIPFDEIKRVAYTQEDLLEYLDNVEYVAYIPTEIVDRIRILWLIRYLVVLGEDESIKHLYSDAAIRAIDTLKKKTEPLIESNTEISQKCNLRDKKINDEVVKIRKTHTNLIYKTAIANHLIHKHPELVRKSDGTLLKIDRITKIINSR